MKAFILLLINWPALFTNPFVNSSAVNASEAMLLSHENSADLAPIGINLLIKLNTNTNQM